jgi:hypothetical protein
LKDELTKWQLNLHTPEKLVTMGGKRPHIEKDNFPNKQFVSIIIKNVHIFTSFEKQHGCKKVFFLTLRDIMTHKFGQCT